MNKLSFTSIILCLLLFGRSNTSPYRNPYLGGRSNPISPRSIGDLNTIGNYPGNYQRSNPEPTIQTVQPQPQPQPITQNNISAPNQNPFLLGNPRRNIPQQNPNFNQPIAPNIFSGGFFNFNNGPSIPSIYTRTPPFLTTDFNINIGTTFEKTDASDMKFPFSYTFLEFYHTNTAVLDNSTNSVCYDSVVSLDPARTAIDTTTATEVRSLVNLSNPGNLN